VGVAAVDLNQAHDCDVVQNRKPAQQSMCRSIMVRLFSKTVKVEDGASAAEV
jgi:hypothetical protein